MNLQRLWSLGGRLAVVLPCSLIRDVRRPGTFLLLRDIRIICCARLIKCLFPGRLLAMAQQESVVALGSMLCRFHHFGHYWNLLASGLPLPLERVLTLMFVFLILATAMGGWSIGVCMIYLASTVLPVFQGIRQSMISLREHFKKLAFHDFLSLLG